MRTVDPAKHAARRGQILDAAAGVFAVKGFEAATVAEICRAAGVGSGTLFHYFPDKATVFRAIFQEDHERILAELAALDDTDPVAGFWAIVDLLARDAAEPAAGGLVIALLGRLPMDPRLATVLVAAEEAVLARLTGFLTRLQKEGGVDPDLPAEHAARWVSSIIDGLYLRCGDPGFDAERELRTLRTVLTRFLFR
ncbi:TetR/AcrR family transcriptional regulator [Actinocorallia populi]|uniref:TetR/AcrR family transcriptional regulator n=1 Tax=Actinocorallia populi TaxID=2079200 RepID=UPI00130022E0|nr:TetR/AcrR family transcriptional regulator [Actinocorallia populi]